jgi:hypothetical protein
MDDDTKTALFISSLVAGILIVLVVLGMQECDRADTRKQEYMKACIATGKPPLECRESAGWR